MSGPDLATRPAPAAARRPPAQAPRARTPGSAELRTSGVLLLALLVTLAGLHVILDGVVWWFQLAFLCILLLGSAAIVRRLAPVKLANAGARDYRRLLPPLVSVVVLVLAVTVVFVPTTAILGIIPTTESWMAFQQLVEAGNFSIARQSLPATAITPIMLLLCLGVGPLVILADLLVNTLRSPALAGAPLLVLLAVPSAVTNDITDPIVFVLAALVYLLLLRGTTGRRTALTIGLAATVVVGALVLPLLLPEVRPAQNTNGTGFSSGVNPVLSLGQNLRQDVEHTVLSYTTESGTAQYLRLVSLQNFSGSNWAPDAFRQRSANTTNAIGAPPGLSPDVATTQDQVFVTVHDLTSPWLPLPYPTSRIGGLDGDWYWDSDGLAVKSPNRDARNETYRATSLKIAPTPTQLKSAGTTVPAGFDRFLSLPAGMPKIISETANRVAGGAASNYEKALLLQGYFRAGDFHYSETAPVDQGYDGTGMTVIASFLKAKEGYCIHFASAMAVMARSLGIPSRIAVGFLPGTELPDRLNGRTAFTVTSHNLHAWPELYFEGIGWTRFEPTVSRGEVPAYADVASPDVPAPFNTATSAPSNSAAARPSTSAAPLVPEPTKYSTASAARAASIGTWAWLLIALAVAGVLLLTPAASRILLRRRRLQGLARGSAPAFTAWQEVFDTAADLGIDLPDTATPREAAGLLARSIGGAERGPIDRVRAAVERESYGQMAGAHRGAVLTSSAALLADVRRVIGDLYAAVDRRQRLRATLMPASAWARIRRATGLGD